MPFKNYKAFVDPPYSMQFACFECRKSFKQSLSARRHRKQTPKCPECGKPTWEMGRQFKAPRQNDIKQWKKVEALVRGGMTFHSQIDYRMRPTPKTLREVEPFVSKLKERKLTEGEKMLAKKPQKRRKTVM